MISNIYAITTPSKEKKHIYKIGSYTGNPFSILSKSIISNPDAKIIKLFKVNSVELCKYIAFKIKEEFKHMRLTNSRGTLTEWYDISSITLEIIFNRIDEIQDEMQNIDSDSDDTSDEAEDFQKTPNPNILSGVFYINEILDMFSSNKFSRPSYQRDVDDDRCEILKQYIIQRFSEETFILPEIVLCEKPEEGKINYNILDGQHRLLGISKITLKELKEYKNLGNVQIKALIYKNLNRKQEKTIFDTINKSVPCPYVVLCEEDEKEIVDEFKKLFSTKYGHHISLSQKCITPNINLNTVIDELTRGGSESVIKGLVSEEKISSALDLMEAVDELNTHIGKKLQGGGLENLSIYLRYGPRASHTHDLLKFKNYLKIIEQKAKVSSNSKIACYLGMVHPQNWVQYICAHHKYL